MDGSFHAHLLHDKPRLDVFHEAINAVVRPGDVVADLGSGSGVLAYLAVKAGAAKVHAVEMNTYSHRAMMRLVRQNGVSGRVIPTLSDATQWTPPEKIDVVLCELMETGLMHEPIVAIMRNMHATWSHLPRTILPHAVTLLVDGVRLDDTFHGYRAVFPGFRRDADTSGTAVTDTAEYGHLDFTQGDLPEGVNARFQLFATEDAEVDALRIRTLSHLAPGFEHEQSPAYCTPIILPLDKPIEVEDGDVLLGQLAYEFDFNEKPLTYDLRPA